MLKNIKISVVIPTYNSWKTLKPCIGSAKKQTLKPDEIIIVDNASTDGTKEKVKKHFPDVKLVALEKNTGVTGGRNTGIKASSKHCNYIFFFDHDMVADDRMLEELVKVAENNKNIGIVTPKIYYWKDPHSDRQGRKRIWAAGTGMNLWTGQVLFRGGEDVGQYDKVEEVQVAPAAMLVKKEVIDKIGGFDDRYFATYEDTEFCFRAREVGFLTYYSPSSMAWHKISPEKKDEEERLLSRSFYVARNRIYFMGDYANNFWIFLLFSPAYFIYYFKIALNNLDKKAILEYLKGYVVGVKMEFLVRRLLVNIPFSRLEVLKRAVGFGKKKVLDVGCGNGYLMNILNKNRKWEVTGIDIYEFDVKKALSTGTYKSVKVVDVRKLKSYTKNKYDVVFCSQVLEHLEKKEGIKLLSAMEGLGKKVVATTPRGFLIKERPHLDEGDNPNQIHKSAWSIKDYQLRGYIVRGRGANFLFGDNGLVNKKPFSNKYLGPISNVIYQFTAYLLSPFVYYFPYFSTGLLAMRNTEWEKNKLDYIGRTSLLNRLINKVIFVGERASEVNISGINLARYDFTLKYCKNKTVMELGCGSGYGSVHLANNGAKSVDAYDADRKAINYAKTNFNHKKVNYNISNVEDMSLEKLKKYDVVVALEIIEHLTNTEKLLNLSRSCLNKDGLFIVSTPNQKLSSYDGKMSSNPYHEREYCAQEFVTLLKKHFNKVELFGIFLKDTKKKLEKDIQKNLRWRLSAHITKKRWIRRIVNYLPEDLKRKFTGEGKFEVDESDYLFQKRNVTNAPYFIAVCRL